MVRDDIFDQNQLFNGVLVEEIWFLRGWRFKKVGKEDGEGARRGF